VKAKRGQNRTSLTLRGDNNNVEEISRHFHGEGEKKKRPTDLKKGKGTGIPARERCQQNILKKKRGRCHHTEKEMLNGTGQPAPETLTEEKKECIVGTSRSGFK